MKANYPKKCWYVAATSDEMSQSPLGRRLLGEDVVLWRGANGHVAALRNLCAHRAFPLSHGTVDGDRLVCGYHGCTYDADGTCLHITSQPLVPTGMKVRAFPIREEPPFIWIWLGPLAAATTGRPPHLPWINDRAWSTFGSTWKVGANYMMAHEHYLDFSYAPILHRPDIPEEIAGMPAFNDIEVTETTVSYTRILSHAKLVDWEADATGLDRLQTYPRRESGMFASPAVHRQQWEIAALDGKVYNTTRTHAITPETETSTHVFMQCSRNYALDSDVVTTGLRSFLAEVTKRDSSILEMASSHAGYDGWRGGVEFQADVAALRARRIVAVMLAIETGRSPIRPGMAITKRGDSQSRGKPVTASG